MHSMVLSDIGFGQCSKVALVKFKCNRRTNFVNLRLHSLLLQLRVDMLAHLVQTPDMTRLKLVDNVFLAIGQGH